ncbi:MAG: NAD(P)H-quinone oxidoreductase [Pseudomonadota bacterium]|nr:NAD(P)H-quinone oxidoreductase [Pseudomonadota bacterium]
MTITTTPDMSIPADMTVIDMREPGKPDVLITGQRETPQPAENEVLIKVVAAGVNGPDLVQRRGHYPPPKGASDLLGLEVSGIITATGKDVSRWQIGDRVIALTNGGGYAEFVAVRADHVLTVPEGVDLIDAAGIPETFFTVWSNVFHPVPRPAGCRFLVHGGAGGIGGTAIQLGAAMGYDVLTTVGNADEAEWCMGLGASRAINYHDEDFVTINRDAGGADLILDIIGGDYIARNIKAARADGRIIQLAFNHGSKVEIDLMPVMLKRLTFTGSTLRSRPDDFKAEIAAALEAQIWPLFADGTIRTTTHKTLPLAEAADAHRMMEAASHKGKILLVTGFQR